MCAMLRSTMAEQDDTLETLHLALEGAVDQMVRAQRLTTGGGGGVAEVGGRLDVLMAETVALRNEVRELLFRQKASRPKKLPVL